MSDHDRIRVFDSQGEDYKKAFQVFLDHTDQKRNAKRWLQQVVERLPHDRFSSMREPAMAKSRAHLRQRLTVPLRSSRMPIS